MRSYRAGFLSPVVRRLAAEHALDATELDGTGNGGRVTRADVLAAIAGRAVAPRLEPQPVTATPFSPMRARIAAHMRRSLATSAHAFTSVVADLGGVERTRRAEGERWRADEGFALTYLPFVARAVVDALRDHPFLNASVVDEGLSVHRAVHLGIAVDLDREGLVVPVVRDADVKRLRGIARDAAVLAGRARAGGLSPDDVVGGTITLTNPGPFGTVLSVPIINQPQVAILVTDRVRRVPALVPTADGGEGIAIRPVATLGLSFDHRAVGVDYAAAFLDRVRRILETRDWTQEL